VLWDRKRVVNNVQAATTQDLLDRATVYRSGMEAEALQLIEEELHARGVRPEQIAAHAAAQRTVVDPEGLPRKCCRCRRPATALVWGWHRLGGVVPIFPRRFAYCDQHRLTDQPC
jgi:hypothetical protein